MECSKKSLINPKFFTLEPTKTYLLSAENKNEYFFQDQSRGESQPE